MQTWLSYNSFPTFNTTSVVSVHQKWWAFPNACLCLPIRKCLPMDFSWNAFIQSAKISWTSVHLIIFVNFCSLSHVCMWSFKPVTRNKGRIFVLCVIGMVVQVGLTNQMLFVTMYFFFEPPHLMWKMSQAQLLEEADPTSCRSLAT